MEGVSTGDLGMSGVLSGLKDKIKNEDEDEGELLWLFDLANASLPLLPRLTDRYPPRVAVSPYQDLEKATVLQECRVFNDSNIVTNQPRRCCMLITKLLHIIAQGETLTSSEVTDVFFGVTKLFQSKDTNLRRMMYLFIKEVAEATNPDDVIIVTSSLTKDMNCPEDLYRANSLRVLTRIIDATMLGAIERYIKQAIVDKNALVAGSALSSGLKLYSISPDVVRRWVNEVQEAVNSNYEMVQYHALGLLYQIKQHDRLAVSKLVTQLSKGSMRSPLAMCLLIRYTTKILQEDLNAESARAAYQFLERCLRHKSEMVVYEAARAICNLPEVEVNDLSPAITALQLFLSSPKVPVKYGALRILNEVANKHSMAVMRCNEDMEALMADPNRSVATLAITTLLKTGSEGSIERLMKQISSFMGDIADEFKVAVVVAIRQVCLKYPQKHRVMVGFLATFLREEGGFDFKKAITDSIVQLMAAIPDTRETGLFHLCDFIEDCEFTALCTQILHLIGEMGPATSAPARYIRFVYNRVILENAAIRAAAVSSLAKFGAGCPDLRQSIRVMLKRSLDDEDDEVRDRACLALKLLSEDGTSDSNGHRTEQANGDTSQAPSHGGNAHLIVDPLPRSFHQLEKGLQSYVTHMSAMEGQPLTLATLPVVEDVVRSPPKGGGASAASAVGTAASTGFQAGPTAAATSADVAAALAEVPQLAALGRIFRSAAPVPLTESETEYVVRCVKHIFEEHVVLDFCVTNTIEDQMLVDVTVGLECSEPELYEMQDNIPLPTLKYNQTGHTYVVFKRNMEVAIEPASFTCELHFKVVDVDPATGEPEGDEEGFAEEYPLEALELTSSDYMAKVSLGDFRRGWEQISSEGEVMETYALQQLRRLEDAVNAVIDFLGMQVCDGTATVPATEKGATNKPHMLHLSGIFVGNVQVMARAQLRVGDPAASGGCLLKIAVRSEDPDVSRMVADCIQ
jgi:coatomer protein complex subunit gamma